MYREQYGEYAYRCWGVKHLSQTRHLEKKKYLLSWSVLTTIGLLSGPSPFEVDARTVMS